jgi:hypothetical protein
MDEFDSERFPGNFYPGMIMRLDRTRRRGLIRSHSGKEIPFKFPFVTVVGAGIGAGAPGIELLNEGDSVGFDVGRTSRGLVVTIIKPKEAPDTGQESKPPSDFEGPSDSGDSQ